MEVTGNVIENSDKIEFPFADFKWTFRKGGDGTGIMLGVLAKGKLGHQAAISHSLVLFGALKQKGLSDTHQDDTPKSDFQRLESGSYMMQIKNITGEQWDILSGQMPYAVGEPLPIRGRAVA